MSDEAPRKRPIPREHYLQAAVRTFARDAVDLPPSHWQFMAFDSAQKATDNQRARMVARGVVPGTPDVGIFVVSMHPTWLELKWGKNSKPSADQEALLGKLNAIGHYAAVARSVEDARFHMAASGIPLRLHARVIAADLDLKVAARIARAEERAASPGSTRVRSSPRYLAGKKLSRRIYAP